MRQILIVLLLAVAGLAHAASPVRGHFAYAVTLDAMGRIVQLAPVADGPASPWPEAVDAALREQLLARRYQLDPGLRAPVRTWISGEFELREDAADYVLEISAMRAGARLAGMKPPLYPVAMVRGRAGADVVLELAVAADGSAQVLASDIRAAERLSGNERRALERAIAESMAQWRFEPPQDASGPLPTRMQVVVQLRITDAPADPGVFEPLPELPQTGPVKVPEADYGPLSVQVTGSRVRRGQR